MKRVFRIGIDVRTRPSRARSTRPARVWWSPFCMRQAKLKACSQNQFYRRPRAMTFRNKLAWLIFPGFAPNRSPPRSSEHVPRYRRSLSLSAFSGRKRILRETCESLPKFNRCGSATFSTLRWSAPPRHDKALLAQYSLADGRVPRLPFRAGTSARLFSALGQTSRSVVGTNLFSIFRVRIQQISRFSMKDALPRGARLKYILFRTQRRRFLLSVDFPTMTEADHQYLEPIILNLIDDAVIADSDSPRCTACQFTTSPPVADLLPEHG